MVALPTVEIPGYARAVRREAQVRESAFLDGNEIVAGIEVRPLSLRTMVRLEQARNGFFVRCTFDNDSEMLAHAVQVLYFSQPSFVLPASPEQTFGGIFRQSLAIRRFRNRILKRATPNRIVADLNEWLDDAFMDAPQGTMGQVWTAPGAAYPAYIVALFAEGGMRHTQAEILDMPLRQLWQFVRILHCRLRGTPMTNPSDKIACDYLAEQSREPMPAGRN